MPAMVPRAGSSLASSISRRRRAWRSGKSRRSICACSRLAQRREGQADAEHDRRAEYHRKLRIAQPAGEKQAAQADRREVGQDQRGGERGVQEAALHHQGHVEEVVAVDGDQHRDREAEHEEGKIEVEPLRSGEPIRLKAVPVRA